MPAIRQGLGDIALAIGQPDAEASLDKASAVVQAQVHLLIDGQIGGKSDHHRARPTPITSFS